MKPVRATMINGVILLILGVLNYLSDTQNLFVIALLPMLFGGLFLVAANRLQPYNIIYYVVLGTSSVLMLLLLQPLFVHFKAGSYLSATRILTMVFSCIVLLVVFYKTHQNRHGISEWKK